MVRIVYDFGTEKITEETVEPNFLLTNKKGGYFLNHNSTKYRGMFSVYKTRDGWDLYKSIDTISVSRVPTEIVYKLWGFEKKYGKAVERFFMHKDSLLYEIDNFNGSALLTLDMRPIHDFGNKGKYKITKENNFTIISNQKDGKTKYLAIKSDSPNKKVEKYSEKTFEFDKKRHSEPSNWSVFEAILFEIKEFGRISLALSDKKEEAMNNANYLYYSHGHLKNVEEKRIIPLFLKKKMGKRMRTAYKCSVKALDDLNVEIDSIKGIYAGLPWFFQIWARDEAISLGALLKEKKFENLKQVIIRQTSNILADGRVPNRMPSSNLGTSDGVGWVFKRFSDVFYYLQKRKAVRKYFSDAELSKIFSKLKDAVDKLLRYYVRQGLTINRKKETWMDTDIGNDPRDGARIEIQALTLNMLKIAKDLSIHLDDIDFKRYEKLERDIKKKVKSLFFKNNILCDGYNDPTIRPNIFLAYYIYPELMAKREWQIAFKKALDALWVEWGGVSTIDKKHHLFLDQYTGMENRSYHRGDSWYFINNIAAICLYRVNRKMFSRYITQIIRASTEEILRMGAAGCHAELSSAKEQRSEGSISQAWSSATYLEMITEIFG